jgi:hypothetical protein
MYKHLRQEKNLLTEKLNESKNILDCLNKEIDSIDRSQAKKEEEEKEA